MRIWAFLILLFGLFTFGAAAQAAGIAKVAGLYGAPTANGRTLQQGDEVQEHDKIVVGSGNVQLIFTDGTKLVVGEHSTLVIEKYLMKGGSQVSNFSVDALSGTFRFITGKSAKKAYDIQTANATIGIRGTGFDFYVGNRTGVVVLEGRVRLCSRSGSACVNINPKCDAGFVQSGTAGHMNNTQFNDTAKHLPYLRSQAFIKRPFWLPVGSCQNKLSDLFGSLNGGNSRSISAPPPGPPPAPDPIDTPGCDGPCD